MSRTLALCLVATLAAAPAFAQQGAPAAPAAPAPGGITLGGPQIPGVCFLAQPVVLQNSRVGVSIIQRLQQLTQESRDEVASIDKPIEAEAKALQAKRATLAPAVVQEKQQALQARYNQMQALASQRDHEITATRDKVLGEVATYEGPVISDVYKARGCGLLLDRNAVLGGNMGGDLTAAVIQGLDAKITTLSFGRESLPPGATSGQ